MKPHAIAVVFLALLGGHAVAAGPIGDVLLGGAQMAGQAAAMAGQVAAQGAQAALTAASTVKTEVEATLRDKTNFAVNTVADTFGIDWNKDLKEATDFKVGKCSGNGYCFPRFESAETAAPTLACPKGYNATATLPVAGELMCVKKTRSTSKLTFRSLKCPSGTKAGNQTCLDPKIQEVMTGLLVAFKVKAMLPFKVLPGLAMAIKAAVVAKPVMALSALEALKSGPFAQLASPPAAADAVAAIKSLVASATGGSPLNVTSHPLEDFAKGLMACNVSEVLPVLPQLQDFVSGALAGVQNLTDEVKAATKVLPLCCSECTMPIKMVTTELKMPALTCPGGLKLDSLALLCSGKNSGYAACPKGMTKCPAGVGKRPVCVAATEVFGMDSCAVLTAMATLQKLPMTACPAA